MFANNQVKALSLALTSYSVQSKGCEYTLDYDALGRVTARTDGEGNTTTFAYHPGGQSRTVTAPNGAKLYQAEYDVWGRPFITWMEIRL